MKRKLKGGGSDEGEFLWLVSLSDLMILLFILFVTLYSFSYKKLKEADVSRILAAFRNQKYQDPVANIERDVSEWVRRNDLEKQIAVTRDKDGSVKVEIRDQVIFQSGQFRLHARGKRTLASLSDSLGRIPPPYRLGIEGHTDDTPVRSRTIEDNFDLSGRRALAVFHALALPESMRRRTVLMAHGPNQPVVPNRTKDGRPITENQTQNRRVTLRIF